jgi:hypothetical protein
MEGAVFETFYWNVPANVGRFDNAKTDHLPSGLSAVSQLPSEKLATISPSRYPPWPTGGSRGCPVVCPRRR